MQVRVLGPFELLGADDRSLDIGGPKERAVLAMLALHANQVVSEDRLADALWGDAPPRTADRTLQVYLSRIRKVLKDAGSDSSIALESSHAGWTLRLAPEALDLTAVEAQIARGRTAAADDDPLGAALAFADALRAWRGRPLDEFADRAWAVTEATRLAELRLLVVEERIDAELTAGRHAHVIGELEGICREHPLRERPWGQRMLALYRSGRQAEALRVYQELRTVLTDELGIEPSPAVARLEQAILAHDPELELPTASTAVSAASGSSGLAAVLFTDLVASTELLGRIGDEAFDAVRREHFEALRETIAEVGGREVKSLGDGLMAAFPSVLTACSCAIAIQRRTARQNRRPGGERLAVRVGLDVGETTQEGDDHFGTVVVTAKRLCDVAGDGEIVVSRFVAELVGSRGGFELSELPPVELKGFTEALTAFSIAWDEEPVQGLPPALVSLRPARFVGREHELGVLHAAWERAREGARQVVLVAGEPGIGKTALAQHVAEQAAASGANVMFGRCDEESVVPFQPFLEAISHHCEMTDLDELRHQLGGQAKDLALLVPVLSARLPEVGREETTGVETDRFRIFDAVVSLFGALQAEAPVVLVLDDLHWADRPTLQLLQHLLRRDSDSALLVIGTYRDTDLVRTHPLAEVLVDLRRADLVDRLPLRGLRSDDVVALVGDEALAATLWQETEGSPLFLREILRHLEETDAIEASVDGGYVVHRRLDQLGVPEGVREVIGRRLSRLSDDTNLVLRLGSVLGRELRLDLLERITDLQRELVLDALERATESGLVDEHPTAVGRWSFTHALVRQALYDELSLTRRVLIHQQVGEALEAIHGIADGPHLAEMAYHFTQAAVGGAGDKAIRYGRRAGELAVRQAAYEQGAELFAAAWEVTRDLRGDPDVMADLLLARADATYRAGDPPTARAYVQEVVALLGDEDPERLGRAALTYFGDDIRSIPPELGRTDRAGLALAQRALAALPSSDHPVRARLLGTLALQLGRSARELEDNRRGAEEAVAMARRLGDTRALPFLLNCAWIAFGEPASAQRRLEIADEALALAQELGEVQLQYFGHAGRLVTLVEVNRVQEAREELELAEAVLEQTRSPYDREQLNVARAVMAACEGRFADADRHIEEAFAIGQQVHDANSVLLAGIATLCVRSIQGRAIELLPLLPQLSDLVPDLESVATVLVGCVAAEAGLLDEARRALAAQPLDGVIAGSLVTRSTWPLLAGAYEALDDVEGAARLYETMLPYQDEVAGTAVWCSGTVAEALGQCAAVGGRADDAERHFERAVQICTDNAWDPLIARVEVRQARLLAASDDDDRRRRAVDLANDALGRAERLGLEQVRSGALVLLRQLTGSPYPVAADIVTTTRRERLTTLLLGWGRAGIARWTRDHSDEELVRRFGTRRAQRLVFGAMARAFQPAMAYGFEGEITFELLPPTDHVDSGNSDWWTLEIRGRRAKAMEGRGHQPAATFHLGVADFVRLGAGEVEALQLFDGRRARFEGQLDLGFRIPSMFGLLEAGSLGV